MCVSATEAVRFVCRLQRLYDLCISYRDCKICVSAAGAVVFVYQLHGL